MSQAIANELKQMRAEIADLQAKVRDLKKHSTESRSRLDVIEETYAKKRGPKPGERLSNGTETQTTF